jgi:hypothetical protein
VRAFAGTLPLRVSPQQTKKGQKRPFFADRRIKFYLFSASSRAHFWLATVQLVLHADWQLAWHSPHAVFLPV